METRTIQKRPQPADFENYREFLKAMVSYLKANQRGFSYRWFARRAGFNTPSLLKHVLDGDRNLATDSIEKFAKGLGLDAKEKADFGALVMLSQAKTDEERNYYYGRLRRYRKHTDGRKQMEKAHYEAYSLWWALPVREMVRHPDFQEDPAWIARRLHPPVKPYDIERALRILLDTGLLVREGNGVLKAAHNTLETPSSVSSLAVRNYHRRMLENALASLDGLPQEERYVTSVTVNLTRSQYEELGRRISAFQDEILSQLVPPADSSEPRDVYFIGFQAVPVTRQQRSKK